MDEKQSDDAAVERDDRIEDLEVERDAAEQVKGGKKSSPMEAEAPGTDFQHNETLLRS